MQNRPALLFAVLATCIASSALWMTWLHLDADSAPRPAADPFDESVQRELRDLRQRLAELQDAQHATPQQGVVEASDRSRADDALQRRVERLEALLGAAGDAAKMAAGRPAAPGLSLDQLETMITQLDQRRRQGEQADQAVQRSAMTERFLDATHGEDERLRALRHLRGAGREARSGSVAQAAIALVQTSASPETRADVWRQMSGADEPMLVPHLLQSLQSDPDARVREEAAETVADYREVPGVAAALQTAMQHDADDAVRRQAERSLRRER